MTALAVANPSAAIGAVGRWVHDPTDELACVRALTTAHDLAAARIVCHTSPGASWPVLVRDLLCALGKDRDALAHDRRVHDGPRLLAVWLRAEAIQHVVVLRAHTLAPAVRTAIVDLGAASGITVWLVWHRRETPPPVAGVAGAPVAWPESAALLRRPASSPVVAAERAVAEVYGLIRGRARLDARAWATRSAPVEPRFVAPGGPLSVALQRLTIDATSHAELLVRLHAARAASATTASRSRCRRSPTRTGSPPSVPVREHRRSGPASPVHRFLAGTYRIPPCPPAAARHCGTTVERQSRGATAMSVLPVG